MASRTKIIRLADCPVVPWKNGGGTTTEIALSPEGAGLDAFDWRVSMAEVASDGPFSLFPGIDRTLTVLEGEGMELRIEGREPVMLGQGSDPVAFPGDVPTSAVLKKGPIRDLNVMTRRGRFRHHVRCVRTSADFSDIWTDIALMLFVGPDPEGGRRISGEVTINKRFYGASHAIELQNGASCYLVCIDSIS